MSRRTCRRSAIRLTPGEHQILKLLNEGMNDAQIAKQLRYRKHTVFVYISYARAKVGGNSRWEMIERARRFGLVRTPRGAKRPPLVQLTRRQKHILEMMRRHLGTARSLAWPTLCERPSGLHARLRNSRRPLWQP